VVTGILGALLGGSIADSFTSRSDDDDRSPDQRLSEPGPGQDGT